MKTQLLADNWTLQNAGEFIHGGLGGESFEDLVIPDEKNSFHYVKGDKDLVRFDALCQFLTNLVLSDQVWVDADYTSEWSEHPSVMIAKNSGVVVGKKFREFEPEWVPAREIMARELCVNRSLLKAHQKNQKHWTKHRTAADEYLSQLVWGGGGMLARASYFRLPYAPHPLRERLFVRAKFMQEPDAMGKLQEFLLTERLKIFRQTGKAGFWGRIHLPPVVVQVIRESQTLDDLVPTALQIRGSYKELRGWLGQLQNDLDNENVKEVLKHQKRLQSVSRHIESYSALTPPGDTTIQFGMSWLKIGAKGGSPLNAILNKVGMRAELNRLVLFPAGIKTISKLLRMLGDQYTKKGRALKAAIEARAAEQSTS